MKLERVNPIGQRGYWFVVVKGQSLPCVHDSWMNKPTAGCYFDRYAQVSDPRWAALAKAIGEKKLVVVQRDGLTQTRDVFERLGYIGVFAVENVVFRDGELSFRFVRRVYETT